MCFFILGQRHRAAKLSVVRYEGFVLVLTALVLPHTFVNNNLRDLFNHIGEVWLKIRTTLCELSLIQ